MSRVWKKFLFKVGRVVLILVSYVSVGILLILGLLKLGVHPDVGAVTVLIVMALLPIGTLILIQVFRDCKSEVAAENKKIMRDLGRNF